MNEPIKMGQLREIFAVAQRSAQRDLAQLMGKPANFFDIDPQASEKLVAFMEEKGFITMKCRNEDSLCRPATLTPEM